MTLTEMDTVTPEIPILLGPIVVGVDGSNTSIEALREGNRIARALGTGITAVTVWSYPHVPMGVSMTSTGWTPERDAQTILRDAIEQAFGADIPPGLNSEIVEGNPSASLMRAAEGSTMLVVGTRGHGGFLGLLMGSVSSACAEHASCPVLVVR